MTCFESIAFFKVKVMGLTCNLFSNTNEAMKNHENISIKNKAYLFGKINNTNTLKNMNWLLYILKICYLQTNWDSIYLYIDAHVVIEIPLVAGLIFENPYGNSEIKAGLPFNNLICGRSPDITIIHWFI
jgi:hypothetical protein